MERPAVIPHAVFPWLAASLAIITLAVIGSFSYLVFHSLVELFSIFVAISLFTIAWNAKEYNENNFIAFIGVAYLFVGLIDLFHTLTYKGMGINPDNTANLPTQAWVLARYFESISILLGLLLINVKLSMRKVFSFYAMAAAAGVGLILGGRFPDCFVEPGGLTAFKKSSEYIISAILLLGAYLLYRERRYFDKGTYNFSLAAIILTILSELTFTYYVGVYDSVNLKGHLLKLASFYCIYAAILKTAYTEPQRLLYQNTQNAKEKLAKTFASIKEGILIEDASTGTIEDVNEAFLEMWGYDKLETIGQSPEFLHVNSEAYNGFCKHLHALLADGEELHLDYEFRRKDGSLFTAEVSATRLVDKPGNRASRICVFRDITERKKMEDSLRLLEKAIITTKTGITFRDTEDIIRFVNPADAEMHGYEPEELLGADIGLYSPSKLRRRIFKEELFSMRGWARESVNMRRNGSAFPVQLVSDVVKDDNGVPLGIITTCEDISDRKANEQMIRDFARRQDDLLREVNHRVKNNLFAMISILQYEQERIGSDSRAFSVLKDIEGRLAVLLSVYSMLASHEWRPLNLSMLCKAVIKESLQVMHVEKGSNITVSRSEVLADSGMAHSLSLVINELVTNSAKCMKGDPRPLDISLDITREKGATVLRYRDNGPGYPEDILAGRFERAGVGFAIIRGITDSNLRGSLRLSNEGGAIAVITMNTDKD